MAEGRKIDINHLPPMFVPLSTSYVALPEESVDFDAEMDRFERRLLLHAFEKAAQNKARAAKMLGIDRNRFRNKLKKYGMDDE
jgi:DNA-binding NtrC family response regulator